MNYNFFDEQIFSNLASSNKEGVADIADDAEEAQKIDFELTGMAQVNPRVDYSDFSNHIFFGSAYAATNFALSRLVNDYPIDGELKDKNEWRRVNSGFENWFYDNFPKKQGYAFFVSSSVPAWISLSDFENKLFLNTSSVTVEMFSKVHENVPSNGYTLLHYHDPNSVFEYKVSIDATKNLAFLIKSGSTSETLTAPFDKYISASNHIACVYDYIAQNQVLYVNGQPIASGAVAPTIGAMYNSPGRVLIGISSGSAAPFSGAIDDARIWLSRRTDRLIRRNAFRPTNANYSGSLKLYYKFNEPTAAGSTVIDYSGNQLHGKFSGSFSYATNLISGTLSPFVDPGDAILDLQDATVVSFVEGLRTSGDTFDRSNKNYIFNLVPSFFIEEEESEDQQRFLLLVARHYDRLKLYIQHLSNLYITDAGEFDNTPDELLSFAAANYGIDLGSVYEGAGAVEYFFGEDVLTSGSLAVPLKQIRSQLRRNLLSNMSYIIKTKSTREALKASLRSMGLSDDVLSINEYSIFSGGITTSREQKTVERRAFRCSGSNVFLTSSVYSNTADRQYEIRALMNTGSANLTSSIFTAATGSAPIFYVQAERENLTSSMGRIRLSYPGATPSFLTSSLLPVFDNKWVNINFANEISANRYSLFVTQLDRDELSITGTMHTGDTTTASRPVFTNLTCSLGMSGSSGFDGYLQEFRAWSRGFSASVLQSRGYDFESLAVDNFVPDISRLITHLKLNDFTASAGVTVVAHDYVANALGSSFSNISSSAGYNFPGLFIDKLEQGYSYDIGSNNDKIRNRTGNRLTKNDIIEDLPYLSVDISPAISLNKEIVRWFGDLEKFNNLIGHSFYRYKDEIEALSPLKQAFFSTKMNKKINLGSYLNLIKWFDANFSYFLAQLMPLDLNYSLSNLVIEPHLFEYNKVQHIFPFSHNMKTTSLSAVVSTTPTITASAVGHDYPLADPGRWGAAGQAGGSFQQVVNYEQSTRGSGINFQNDAYRNSANNYFSTSLVGGIAGYGNGFYSAIITGSSYMKTVLNINPDFDVSKIRYENDGIVGSTYLSISSERPANTDLPALTSSFNGLVDQRWQWAYTKVFDIAGSGTFISPPYDVGIGYGGGWGQLYGINGKSLNVAPNSNGLSPLTLTAASADIFSAQIGRRVRILRPDVGKVIQYVDFIDPSAQTKSIIFWPTNDAFDGVKLVAKLGSAPKSFIDGTSQVADFLGERISIEGYSTLDANMIVRLADVGSPTSPEVSITLKFQFFNDDLPGDHYFESIHSSSKEATGYQTTNVDHVYYFTKEFSASRNEGLTFQFNRELPLAKYMRIHVQVELPNGNNDVGTTYKVLFKGNLYKTKKPSVQETILKLDSGIPNPDIGVDKKK